MAHAIIAAGRRSTQSPRWCRRRRRTGSLPLELARQRPIQSGASRREEDSPMAIATQTPVVTPVHSMFAAEITGVDVTRPLDDAAFERVANAFDDYSVLVFRGQALADEQQMAFSERFGPLETTVRTLGNEDRLGAHIVDLSNVGEDGQLMGWSDRRMLYQSGNQLWHS